jgi:murein tripeptide amidase MpaA
MIKDFEKKAYRLLMAWEKTYRKEARECDHKALYWVYCEEEAREDEKQYQKDVQTALQGQIDFIKYHVALMTFPGPTIENLDRIERFLSM